MCVPVGALEEIRPGIVSKWRVRRRSCDRVRRSRRTTDGFRDGTLRLIARARGLLMTQPPYAPPPGGWPPSKSGPGQPPYEQPQYAAPAGQPYPAQGHPGYPPPGWQAPPPKPPLYKRPWFILVAALFALGVVGSALGGNPEETTPAASSSTTASPAASSSVAPPPTTQPPVVAPAPAPTTAVVPAGVDFAMPNTVGMDLQSAQNLVQDNGVFLSMS